VHLVFGEVQHEKMLLAEPLKVADILFPDYVAFLKGTPLEFSGPDLRNIMSKHRAYRLMDGYRFRALLSFLVGEITHENLP
jgi:hypothetical protein